MEPGTHCRLKEMVISQRNDFLLSIKTIAQARREESEYLTRKLPEFETLNGIELLRCLGEKPHHVGDVVIFWEVPGKWTVLTKDRSFSLLREAHRRDLGVFIVRARRYPCEEPCSIARREGGEESFAGVLKNYSASGALLSLPGAVLRAHEKVQLRSAIVGIRDARVVRHDLNKGSAEFGLHFVGKRP